MLDQTCSRNICKNMQQRNTAYFSPFGNRQTEPALSLETLLYISSCPSTFTIEREPNIGIKLRRNTTSITLTSLFHLPSQRPFISILTNVFPEFFSNCNKTISTFHKNCCRIDVTLLQENMWAETRVQKISVNCVNMKTHFKKYRHTLHRRKILFAILSSICIYSF